MKKSTTFVSLLFTTAMAVLIIPFQSPIQNENLARKQSGPIVNNALPFSSSFSIGPGGSDVIPHQIVRTNDDYLYIFANQQSSNLIRVYRTTQTGLPSKTSDFATPIQFGEASNPIGIDAVYDGGTIIHVLINLLNGQVKDYPFDTVTNTFKTPVTLASNGGIAMLDNSGFYVGTSGVAGMVDKNGILHVAYWTNTNHILHGSYTYNNSTNVLTLIGNSFDQVDTAGNANHPAIAVSPLDNTITIAWVSQSDNPPAIRTRTLTNGTWGSVLRASTASVWTSIEWGINIDQGPSLLIDSTGTKHLTYIESCCIRGDYGRIHYVTDTGSGWVDQSLNAFSHDPALAVNSYGDIYIIGHGHPNNPTCLAMTDMCTIKKSKDGTWENPQLFATPAAGGSFDSSPSVKWSVVGFNRPDVIEFIFFMIPYDHPTIFYGSIQNLPALNISGKVGVAGATLQYIDGPQKTTTSNSDGSYSIQVPPGWSGTVTPTHPCYTFSPVNRTYVNVAANQTVQDYTAAFNPASGCANVEVVIGTNTQGSYGIPPGGKEMPRYGMAGGPVRVKSANSKPIFASQRAAYLQSFNELMGYPANQLTTEYWFTYYDDIYMSTWLMIGNAHPTQTAEVDVYIGGGSTPTAHYSIAKGQSVLPRFGIAGGPVRVVSTNGVPIFTSQRAAYLQSFNELMGYPANQLTTEYWFTYYDDIYMSTWLMIGNPDATRTAEVDVYIGGGSTPTAHYSIPKGQSVLPRFGIAGGPVRVVSTNGVPIFASQRAAYLQSFNELMGYPANQLTTEYWFTYYDDIYMSTWLMIGNAHPTQTAEVDVYIGGGSTPTAHYSIPKGQSVLPRFGIADGPVRVKSTNGVPIFTSQRAAYLQSFNELMGYPANQLTTEYWFTYYDDIYMSTWLMMGVP